MIPSNEHIRASIAEQANEWFTENRCGPLDPESSVRFMVWLKTSPAHVEEYLAAAAAAAEMKTVARALQTPLETLLARARVEADNVAVLDHLLPGQRPTVPRYRLSRGWSLAAAAALVCVAVAAIWLTRDGESFGLSRTYRTAHGEQSMRVLPDGSVLHLNTDSEVTVHFSHHERVVDLEHGQAFFQVRHQGGRGFRVAAGNTQILDVGTQFDVYRRPDVVLVTVLEGTAAVYRGPPPVASENPVPTSARPLTAGYRLEVRSEVGTPQPVDAQAAVAWLRKQIAFKNERLGTVADEFNRYGAIPIYIADEALRSLAISGVFTADDSETFIAFLRTLNGVTVETTPTQIRVLRRTAPDNPPGGKPPDPR
jgi:transmembrane sensor